MARQSAAGGGGAAARKIAAGYRAGAHLAPQNPIGTVRFEDYLRRS